MEISTSVTIMNKAVQEIGKIQDIVFYKAIDEYVVYVVSNRTLTKGKILGSFNIEVEGDDATFAELVNFEDL
jgi:hypothetical protein